MERERYPLKNRLFGIFGIPQEEVEKMKTEGRWEKSGNKIDFFDHSAIYQDSKVLVLNPNSPLAMAGQYMVWVIVDED